MGNLIIKNARIVTPTGRKAACGEAMSRLRVIDNAEIHIVNGMIVNVGPSASLAPLDPVIKCNVLDAKGCVVMPGFVDSHTHLVFGGFRPDEFRWRLNGESYMSIMERGGGIQSTVDATRTATHSELLAKARWFTDSMIRMGVTTVEVKSGYGLDLDNELKMLEVARSLQESEKDRIGIATTFLGAHAVPTEYKGRTAEYVDYLISDVQPRVKGKAEFCDVFCEKNVFEIEDSRRLLKAASDAGFGLKLHADEIVTLGGAELAAELGAVSADHLLHVSDRGVHDMAKAGVVATLLPLTAFALKEPYAPARKFIDAGAAVALATDLNPGSCFSGSIPLTIALACIYMGMSIEETITALTLNGAAAIGRADTLGSIELAKRGNLVVLGTDNYNVLPYYVGMNCVRHTIYEGNVVATNP